MRKFYFQHIKTGEWVTIKARSRYEAWTVLRRSYDHREYLRARA